MSESFDQEEVQPSGRPTTKRIAIEAGAHAIGQDADEAAELVELQELVIRYDVSRQKLLAARMRHGDGASSGGDADVSTSSDLYGSARLALRRFIVDLCERWNAQTGEK